MGGGRRKGPRQDRWRSARLIKSQLYKTPSCLVQPQLGSLCVYVFISLKVHLAALKLIIFATVGL